MATLGQINTSILYMAVNKNALLRYRVLDRCFGNTSRNFYWQDLLKEINEALEDFNGEESHIQRRQLFEDIKFMESDQGWSIPLVRIKDGRKVHYKYSEKNFSISNQALNENEVSQLEAAISVLSRFSGAPQFEWVQELIPVLNDRLGLKQNTKEVISVESNLDLIGISHLPILYECIINELVIEIEYKDFKSDSSFFINFHPYFLKQYNNRWFVFGLNEEYDVPTWNLALDRIKNIEQTQKEYKQDQTDWKDYFYDIVGVTKHIDKEVETVKIRFNRESAPYILTKPLHPTQKFSWIDESLIIEIKVIPNYELESLILSFGEIATVLEPKKLVLRIKNRLEESRASYLT